jgi:hypothetical protein
MSEEVVKKETPEQEKIRIANERADAAWAIRFGEERAQKISEQIKKLDEEWDSLVQELHRRTLEANNKFEEYLMTLPEDQRAEAMNLRGHDPIPVILKERQFYYERNRQILSEELARVQARITEAKTVLEK